MTVPSPRPGEFQPYTARAPPEPPLRQRRTHRSGQTNIGHAAERDAPSTAPADPREQGYGIGERPWRRRQLGRCSGQHCQVSVEQNFGPCQERYQRRSIGFKPEGVISPSGANVPDRVGKRGIRQGRTSNFATAMWVDRLQHVNRRPNGNPPESGLSD